MSNNQENSETINKGTKQSKFWCMLQGFIVGILGIVIILFIFVPTHSDNSARTHLAETIASLADIKIKITENANTTGKLSGAGKEFRITPAEFSKYSAAYLNVSEDGVIVVKSDKYGQIVVFVPRMSGKEVVWDCLGAPKDLVSPNCR